VYEYVKNWRAARGLVSDNNALSASAAGVVTLVFLVGFGMFLNRITLGNPIDSLVVLPFSTRLDSDSQAFAESLVNRLSASQRLRVVSQITAFERKPQAYGDKERQELAAIGRELGVDAVLTGSYYSRGNQITIFVNLVDARDNSLLWGKFYDIYSWRQLSEEQAEIESQVMRRVRSR
jgi:TolB-like protein